MLTEERDAARDEVEAAQLLATAEAGRLAVNFRNRAADADRRAVEAERVAGPGDTCAKASLFEVRHDCDGIAAAPSSVFLCPAAELRRAATTDPGLAWRVAAHLAHRLVAERARAERLALPHAADRLLDALHALPASADGSRHPDRPWRALAAELGLSHEATYRALARLERAGLLHRQGRDRVHLPRSGAR